MSEKRVTVWVQHFADRPYLMLQWLDPDTGKRKSKSAKTDNEEAAEKKRADLEYELNHGLHAEPSKMTWEQFRELFEAEYVAGTRMKTQETFRSCLDRFERLANPRQLRSINERTLSGYLKAMRAEPVADRVGLAASTIKVALQFLRTALRWGVKQRLLPVCPSFPVVKVPKKKPRPVSAEAFERMLERSPDANVTAFLFAGWLGGLRLAEAIMLEWKETEEAPYLDLERDRIVFPAQFVKAVEDQWVPLHKELRRVVEALPRNGPKVFRFVKANGEPIKEGAVSARIVRLAALAGVRLTMRSLRRGFGCHHAARVPAQVLQRLMRHANISTTVDYYANVDDAVEQAIRSDERNILRNSAADEAPHAAGSDCPNSNQDKASG
jgi:integrase